MKKLLVIILFIMSNVGTMYLTDRLDRYERDNQRRQIIQLEEAKNEWNNALNLSADYIVKQSNLINKLFDIQGEKDLNKLNTLVNEYKILKNDLEVSDKNLVEVYSNLKYFNVGKNNVSIYATSAAQLK